MLSHSGAVAGRGVVGVARKKRGTSAERDHRNGGRGAPPRRVQPSGRYLDVDLLRGEHRQDAARPRVAPHTTRPEPRVGHHRDGHDESEDASTDADDALRERPGSCTHQFSLCIRMECAWAAGAVTRRARTSRAYKNSAAARINVAQSMVCQEGQGFASLERW